LDRAFALFVKVIEAGLPLLDDFADGLRAGSRILVSIGRSPSGDPF
jgi:hypothetical protein